MERGNSFEEESVISLFFSYLVNAGEGNFVCTASRSGRLSRTAAVC